MENSVFLMKLPISSSVCPIGHSNHIGESPKMDGTHSEVHSDEQISRGQEWVVSQTLFFSRILSNGPIRTRG